MIKMNIVEHLKKALGYTPKSKQEVKEITDVLSLLMMENYNFHQDIIYEMKLESAIDLSKILGIPIEVNSYDCYEK